MPESNFHNVDFANTRKQTHDEPHRPRCTKCNLSGTKLYLMRVLEPDEKALYLPCFGLWLADDACFDTLEAFGHLGTQLDVNLPAGVGHAKLAHPAFVNLIVVSGGDCECHFDSPCV